MRTLSTIVPLALLVGALSLLAACAPAGDIRIAEPIGQIESPQLVLVPGRTSIERFDPPGTGTGLELTIGALIRNPNPFGVSIEQISYRVVITDVEVSVGTLPATTFLEPGATAPVQFDIVTDLERKPRLLRAILRAFADDPLPFEIHGRVSFSSSSYAFQTRERLLLRGATLARQNLEQPRLSLDEAASRVYLLRAGVPIVHVVINVANPGDIGYFLYGRDVQLALGGIPVGHEDLPPTPIPARQASRIDLLFYPVPSGLPEAGMQALDAALGGIPTLLELSGDHKLDVLGVDTFDVASDWTVHGFVDADR